jgi:hypothetical protein
MTRFIFTALLLSFLCCTKKEIPPDQRPFLQWDRDITNIYAHAASPWRAGDTTGNYISDLSFGITDTLGRSSDTTFRINSYGAGYWSTWGGGEDKHIYSIRYIPDVPLIDSGGYTDYEAIRCPMNPALAGQEIFEVVDTTLGKVYSKIYARKHVTLYLKTTAQPIDPSALRKAYNYYFQKIHATPLYGYRIGG